MTRSPPRPEVRPANPCFSSGPCAKRPGWSVAALGAAALGRSHRSAAAKAKIAAVIERSRALLGIPDDYSLAVVPASDTGAVEMALWSLLGPRGVEILVWDSFGEDWAGDVVDQLWLDDVQVRRADYGALPDLGRVDWARDVVFAWNGTTSGVRPPNGDWIAADRAGLAICDATSAVFAMALPWPKLDVVTWSWQKVLGGEAQHGMLALSPRAVARLETYTPPWPLPKIFRMTKGGRLNAGLFRGETINTPSMLCVEDQLDALGWAGDAGGVAALIARSEGNLQVIADWVDGTVWVDFLAQDPASRSCTSVCLSIADAWFGDLAAGEQRGLVKIMSDRLAEEGVAYDVNGYRDAPPGLRVWAGATVERSDIEALLPWLDWAYALAKAQHGPR